MTANMVRYKYFLFSINSLFVRLGHTSSWCKGKGLMKDKSREESFQLFFTFVFELKEGRAAKFVRLPTNPKT